MQVIGYKLPSGEEIIGRVDMTDLNTNFVTLSKVRIVGLQPDQRGGVGVAFFPWSACCIDSPISIDPSKTLTPSGLAPESEVEQLYVQQTTSIIM